MILTVLQGHGGSAKIKQISVELFRQLSKQHKRLTCYRVDVFLTWPWLWKRLYGLTSLFALFCRFCHTESRNITGHPEPSSPETGNHNIFTDRQSGQIFTDTDNQYRYSLSQTISTYIHWHRRSVQIFTDRQSGQIFTDTIQLQYICFMQYDFLKTDVCRIQHRVYTTDLKITG